MVIMTETIVLEILSLWYYIKVANWHLAYANFFKINYV